MLNTIFKTIKLSIFEQITTCANEFLSVFMGAYRKHYGTQHVLIGLLEEWIVHLDQSKMIGAVLLDIFKDLFLFF